ncbi:TPA: polysaccharide pyruvyl transferase family protein, partial [Streptococcus suis]
FKNYFANKKYEEYKTKRIEKFINFTNSYIAETEYYIGNRIALKKEIENFDYFITGSDQVWNPYYNSGSSIYFLDFAPKKKRLSYAPSFGIHTIPNEYIEDYKKWIDGIESLSIREDDGAKIINELTGREASILVDPTLLLRKEEWINLSKQSVNKPNEKYLLTYFLGGIPLEYKSQVEEIAENNDLKIISLGDLKDIETYMADPSEFIDFIKDCSIFCTDSFHGVVFSILLERPFVVYERVGSASMYSRINTLLNKFDLNNRKSEYIDGKNILDVDFSHVPEILEIERAKSINYLKKALRLNDEN